MTFTDLLPRRLVRWHFCIKLIR